MQTIRDDEGEFIKTYQDIADIQAGKHDAKLLGGGDVNPDAGVAGETRMEK